MSDLSSMEVVFLGTGTSHGIPMIACDCPVCRSDDPRDRRNRACVVLRLGAGEGGGGRAILIDSPPELRLAAIANDIRRVDAVLLTHAHADHILGMDDLRRYNNILGGTIPCHASRQTIEIVRNVFGYAERPYDNPDRPSLAFAAIDGPTEICGLSVVPLPLLHGRTEVLGFRIGRFAYCTDCSGIPPATLPLLEGLDLLVLGALRYRPHPAHYNMEQALAAVRTIRPRRTLLTHIAHDISHASLSAELPAGVELAYDGLRTQAASFCS
jgi:phosphoribosyl 1,2-cyclic phosphate phosphodiesterase